MSKNIWDEFDKNIDTEGLARDVQEASENSGRRDVPHGLYEVEIKKLELVASKKGDPMVTCWMRIVAGEYSGCYLFMNQVITQGFQIHIVNDFLKDLTSGFEDGEFDVEFKSYNQYGNLLMDILESIDGNFEYQMRFYDQKGYNAYEVEEVYPLD